MGFFTSYKMKKIAKKKKEMAAKKRKLAYLEDQDVILAANRTSQSTATLAWYLSRLTEEQAKRMVKAYINQPSYREREGNDLIRCYYDPIEDEPAFKRIIDEVRIEAENNYPEEKCGQCHYIWWYMEEKLRHKGIDWISPAFMNPHIRFD